MLGNAPPYAVGFQSDDLDEIREFIARYDGNHQRAALGGGPLGYSVRSVRCADVDLGWMRTRVRQKVRGTPQCAMLHLPRDKRTVYTSGRRVFEARPGTALFLPAGQEYTVYTEPDDCLVILRVPAFALRGELLARSPASLPASPRPGEIALGRGQFQALAALHRALINAANPVAGTSRAGARHAEQLAADLCSLMADHVLGTRPASSKPAVGVERIRRVEEWVDAHFSTPITLGRLCAVAGVGDRWLESTFRAYRGQTPLEFVVARRLAWVRRSLLDAEPGATVTELAHEAGFVHLGRFAARYQRAFGESPSQTLRRSQRRA